MTGPGVPAGAPPAATTGHRRRALIIVAATAVALLTGCASGVAPEPSADAAPTEVVVGVVGELTSLNPSISSGATPANLSVADFTHESFGYLDDALQVVGNGGFGEVERISADPLRVQYRIFDERRWSDGTAVSVDDLLFGWAVTSGFFDDAAFADDGSIVSGTRYFDTAASAERLDTRRPLVDRSAHTLTLTYEEPFADWNREWLLDRPAHVVAERAGVSLDALMQAIRTTPKGDPEQPREPDPVLRAAARVWNTGFDVAIAPAVTNGPYTPVEATGRAVTLERNAHYTGDHEPAFDRVVLRFFADEDALLDAVAAGKVDVANLGDATAAEIARVRTAGADVHTGARPEVLVLVFTDEFGRVSADIRDGVVRAIDRDRLVAESTRAVWADADPAQSFLATAASGEEYAELAAGNGAPATSADVPAARELLAGAEPVLRIRYEPTDVLAADLFAEIARMTERAGITVRPAGDADAADAELVSLEVGGTLYEEAAERADSGGAAAREAAGEMRLRSDPAEAREFAREVDRALFERGFGLPLVARTGAVATSSDVTGIGFTASPTGIPRYFWTWRPVGE